MATQVPPQTRFGLIFPPTKLPERFSSEVIPGYFLRKATPEEDSWCIELLKMFGPLDSRVAPYIGASRRALWGGQGTPSLQGMEEETYIAVLEHRTPPPGDAWKGESHFEQAASLAELPVNPSVLATIYGRGAFGGFGRAPWIGPWEFWTATPQEIERIATIHGTIVAVSARYQQIAHALELFQRVGRHRESGWFHFAMLMSVVECLLTHRKQGRGDSVSRQLKTKAPLILKRAGAPMSDPNVPADEWWEGLYAIRSELAHGGQLVFSNGHFVSTGDNKKHKVSSLKDAMDFLDAAVRTLLRQSLSEPELVEDLAKC